jgi:hypothetical protein
VDVCLLVGMNTVMVVEPGWMACYQGMWCTVCRQVCSRDVLQWCVWCAMAWRGLRVACYSVAASLMQSDATSHSPQGM